MRLTETDIELFADDIGLPFEGVAATAADTLADILEWYIIAARVQSKNSERATAPEWGLAVAEWAAKGRALLGDDRREVVHLTRAVLHLCNALPPVGSHEEASLIADVFTATGLHLSDSSNPSDGDLGQTRTSVVATLLERTAYSLRALEALGQSVEASGAVKGKQIDYARLALIKSMGRVFVNLFPKTPFNVLTRLKPKTRLGERRAFADGPAVRWCRLVLTTAPDRLIVAPGDTLSEMFELREWAAKPDGIPKVIRKLNAKPRSKLT